MSKIGSDLGTRVVVAVGLIGLAAVALWAGGLGFWLVIAAAALLMIAEWAGLVGASPGQKRNALAAIAAPLLVMAIAPGFFALGLLIGAFFFTGATTRNGRLAFGILYVGLPVLALLVLRGRADGLLLSFWAMALVWACDTGAYFAGRALGGPKLAPQISPNKTWAGFLGGVLAAPLFALALHWWLDLPFALLVGTPVLAVLAQLGDLYESHMKRQAGVKDSGDIVPGHGGVLDRLDGLVAVAPAAALIVLAFVQ